MELRETSALNAPDVTTLAALIALLADSECHGLLHSPLKQGWLMRSSKGCRNRKRQGRKALAQEILSKEPGGKAERMGWSGSEVGFSFLRKLERSTVRKTCRIAKAKVGFSRFFDGAKLSLHPMDLCMSSCYCPECRGKVH